MRTPTSPRNSIAVGRTPAANNASSSVPETPAGADKNSLPTRSDAAENSYHADEISSMVTPYAESSSVFTPLSSAVPASVELLIENEALKDEIANLRKQMKDVLEHSIESDQRLLKYTNEVFVVQKKDSSDDTTEAVASTQQHQTRTETLTAGHSPIIPDETVATMDEDKDRGGEQLGNEALAMNRPCLRCRILEEETTNMISTIRLLEEQLRAERVPSASPNRSAKIQDPHLTMKNDFNDLNDYTLETNTFTLVRTKKTKHKIRKTTSNISKAEKLQKGEERQNARQIDGCTTVPFRRILISGDSHARHIAGLVRERVQRGVDVSSVCKPGAGLLSVAPTSPSQPPAAAGYCHVLMAGTNDVAAGRGDIIYKNLEGYIKQLSSASTLVVSTLPHRHDLPLNSSVNKNIRFINSYISELCSRYDGVEVLDFNRIRRSAFTTHGMHLNMRGKRLLARFISEKLAALDASAPRQHRKVRASAQPALAVPSVSAYCQRSAQPSLTATSAESGQDPPSGTIQEDTYAGVLKHRSNSFLEKVGTQ